MLIFVLSITYVGFVACKVHTLYYNKVRPKRKSTIKYGETGDEIIEKYWVTISSDRGSNESTASRTTPRNPSPTVPQSRDMVNILSGLNMRKLTSGSSSGSSSEITPLLNGSQEGPCYAYSSRNRDDDGELEDSLSTVRSMDDTIQKRSKLNNILNIVKQVFLSAVMIFCVVSLSFLKVRDDNWNSIAITRGKPVRDVSLYKEKIHLRAKGPFLPGEYYDVSQDFVIFSVAKINMNGTYEDVSKKWRLLLAPNTQDFEVDSKIKEHDFYLDLDEKSDSKAYQVTISTNKRRDYVSMSVDVSVRPKLAVGHIIMALCVLIGLYILIIFELVHRTLAAMIGATVAISCLAVVGERPSLMEVLTWMDVETLCLLFGMMVLVSILCETGFFDYVAVLTYKLARGQIWALITGLCLVTAILSAFLDNVTTILLMSAVAIRLCEAMNIDPKHMLIAMVIFSNIGGAMTPIGDPPNIIIISNKKIQTAGIGFGDFTIHMLPAVVLCLAGAYVFLRLIYKDMSTLRFTDPPEVVEVKHEIEVWKKAFNSLSGYSRDEDTVRAILHRKISVLETLLRKKLYDAKISEDDYRASLKELTNAFKLKNTTLLLKSGIIIGIVIIFFFLESIPELNLSIGWIAILGAIFLLVLGDFDELESILSRVEWSTLLFFGALFVVMEALSRLDLVWYIVNMTQDAINGVDESHRLLVAIVLVLWISALSSSFIDNIPFTTVMVQVVADIADNEEMKLPIKPLVFALALGACLGGNGTLIGASANVVTAGLSEQHGYRFSFYDFFRVGFPVMILTTAISTAYLLFCHVWLGWNY
ncbi:p protein [Trichonephila inaurata madagascariensis]|uniref:P protein n=1 Tax=Trichonephila inaurata madagascariensis TaxID=2747483 RepID=A0A8X6YMV7_9ARAC|nr:p protein [Trichonephila inaurata madagascariensis]